MPAPQKEWETENRKGFFFYPNSFDSIVYTYVHVGEMKQKEKMNANLHIYLYTNKTFSISPTNLKPHVVLKYFRLYPPTTTNIRLTSTHPHPIPNSKIMCSQCYLLSLYTTPNQWVQMHIRCVVDDVILILMLYM